jgi:hypothetical protein
MLEITLKEVLQHADSWFRTVMSGGSADTQAQFFNAPNPFIYILSTGDVLNMDSHYKLHQRFENEVHGIPEFLLTRLSPQRIRVTGTVYWEAEIKNQTPPNCIKAVVGEDWILEKNVNGELKFILYMNTFHHLLPDSAPLKL